MRAGSVVGTSYGAMMTVIAFLKQNESITMQQLSQWWYKTNLARLQLHYSVRYEILHETVFFLCEGTNSI